MNNKNIFFIVCSLICFITPIILCELNQKKLLNKIKLETSVVFLPVACLTAYVLLFWSNLDFISDTFALKFISPFVAVVAFALQALRPSRFATRFFSAVVLSCMVVLGFNYTPQIIPSQPLFLNQLLLIAFWCFITFSLRFLNILSGIICCQLSIFCFGICILYLIGCAPEALNFVALCVGLPSLVFTIKSWPPVSNIVTNNQIDTLGFMLGAFFVNGSAENLTSPLFIFILYFLCELSLALLKKITFISYWKNIYQNTSCAKALSSELSPQIIAHHFLRMMILLLVIGCFQVFSPYQYSLIAISTLICCWQMYRLSNWQDLSSGWIDSSKKIKKELQQSLKAIKKNFHHKEEPK